MGQKVHPYIFRILNGKNWKSSWFAKKKNFATFLHQDLIIKNAIKKEFKDAGIADIGIERYSDKLVVKILTSRPGVIIGKEGAEIDRVKLLLQVKLQTRNLELKVEEVRKAEAVASLVAESIAHQIERRVPYRKAVKQALEKSTEAGVKGIKVKVGGRLNGSDIARRETFSKGAIPLHTIRSNIDFSDFPAHTTYGAIGVKVWLYHGEF